MAFIFTQTRSSSGCGPRSRRDSRSSAAGRAPASVPRCREAGGIDLLVIYNSGRFRMAGRGSLAGLMPYGDANAIVMEMAREVLPVVQRTPVLAGVCGTDPFRVMKLFLRGRGRRRAFPACRTSPRWACSTADSGRTWKRPAWATGWKWT